ncbi:transferase [Desarmillaria ectypa]|nr:transferase [Desarmillaria ectypa]
MSRTVTTSATEPRPPSPTPLVTTDSKSPPSLKPVDHATVDVALKHERPPLDEGRSPIKKSTARSPSPDDSAKSDTSAEAPAPEAPSPPATINMDTFRQILDLDEDETHDFSSSMVWAYFTQVRSTFKKMDSALQAKDLQELSSLGHFLKGSSGQIGVARVEVSCQKIQYYGKLRNEHDDGDISDTQALDTITTLLAQVKSDYDAAESWLKNWYMERGVEGPPADD